MNRTTNCCLINEDKILLFNYNERQTAREPTPCVNRALFLSWRSRLNSILFLLMNVMWTDRLQKIELLWKVSHYCVFDIIKLMNKKRLYIISENFLICLYGTMKLQFPSTMGILLNVVGVIWVSTWSTDLKYES